MSSDSPPGGEGFVPARANQDRQRALQRAIDSGNLAAPGGLLPLLSIHERQLLINYENFVQKVKDVPGVIVEVGVGRGGSLLSLASFEALLHPADFDERVYGFDTFSGFPEVSDRDGGASVEADRIAGGYGYGKSLLDELRDAIALFDKERPYGDRPMIRLIEGDVRETIPQFVAQFDHNGAERHSSLSVKLLHIDCDLYEPTMVTLKHFGPLLSPGAVVILDEWAWAKQDFPGEMRAVKDYFGAALPRINRVPFRQPGGWFEVTPELFGFMHGHSDVGLAAADTVSVDRNGLGLT